MIVWVDVETTGLDPRRDALLEVALVLTDDDLETIDVRAYQLRHPGPTRVGNEQILASGAVGHIDPFVVDMHDASGLWDECAKSKWIAGTVDRELDDLIYKHAGGANDAKPLLGGSSVHFDREFLRHHLPATFDRLHYRNLDISVIKTCIGLWGGPVLPDHDADAEHRALPDILASLNRARFYKDQLFRNRSDLEGLLT